jgi:hypothetical protein
LNIDNDFIKRLNIKIQVLYFITNDFFLFGLMIFIYLIILIIFLIPFLFLYNGISYCSSNSIRGYFIFLNIIIIFFMLISFLVSIILLIFDVVINYKLIISYDFANKKFGKKFF